jgi:hypothetical protein
MPNVPFFSIVMAAYNSAAWIVPAIRSALDQSYRDFEMIVVGDGCTDETGDIVTSEFGSRVRWRNLEKNSGSQSAPNNEGIRLARGTHIAYLGHDDIWSRHHLEALAAIIRAHDPDFAVSGAVYHGPPGSNYYQITGLFSESEAARREFFPPSSLAHRRSITDQIGCWRDPRELRAPVDCEFLLRAATQGCAFLSTKTITVQKFAAGHRYLSYRFPSSAEQERMFDRLRAPNGDAEVLSEILQDIANGTKAPPICYFDFDSLALGEMYRASRQVKGLAKTPPALIETAHVIGVNSSPAALDWHGLEKHPAHGNFRWSGPNPNPVFFLNVRTRGGFALRIRVLAFADETLADALRLEINDQPTDLVLEKKPDGTLLLAAKSLAPAGDGGVMLRFRMPRSVPYPGCAAGMRVGFALSQIEIVPDAPAG